VSGKKEGRGGVAPSDLGDLSGPRRCRQAALGLLGKKCKHVQTNIIESQVHQKVGRSGLSNTSERIFRRLAIGMRSRRGGRSARRRHACPKGRPTELSSVPGSRIAAQVTMQALDEDAAANLAARPTMLGGAPNVRLHAKLTRRASEGPRATFRTAEAAQNTIEHPRLQSDIQSERRTCRRPKQTPTGTAQGLRRNDPSLDGVDPPSCPHPPRTIGCVVFTTCGIRSVGPCGIRKVLWFWAYVLPFVFSFSCLS